jgi:hypothetical protein
LHGLADRVNGNRGAHPVVVLRLVPLVSLVLLCLVLPGCSAPHEGLLTAAQAVAIALLDHPEARLVGVYGVEGPQLQRLPAESERAAFRDDGVPDGAAGDGRLSSWVVGLVQDGRFFEVRARPDGSARVEEEFAEMPAFLFDSEVKDSVLPVMDSPEAARAAATASCRMSPPGAVGFLYAYSLYDEGHPRGLPAEQRDEQLVETLGVPSPASAWTVVRIDMEPGEHLASTVQVGADGDPTECRPAVPMRLRILFDKDVWFDEPVAPEGLPRPPLVAAFDVGNGTQRVVPSFNGQGVLLPGAKESRRDPRTTVVDAAGTTLFDGNAWHRVTLVASPAVPGEWRFEVRNDGVARERLHLDATVQAVERVGP